MPFFSAELANPREISPHLKEHHDELTSPRDPHVELRYPHPL